MRQWLMFRVAERASVDKTQVVFGLNNPVMRCRPLHGDETDSVGISSGRIAIETDSIGILLSGGLPSHGDR